MRKLLNGIIVSTLLFMASCDADDYTQVVTVSATSDGIIKDKNNFYQFENSDIKVVYSFWGDRGILGFRAINKTDHPIYIDWKKSSLINNGKQMPYYTNKTTSNYIQYGQAYGSAWDTSFGRYGYGSSRSSSTIQGSETVVKQERTTFIPPQSYIDHAFYDLTANIYFDVNSRDTKKDVVNGVEAYVSTSTYDIAFRNYITYSESEDFTTEKHVDNGFRIGKVYTIPTSSFDDSWEKPSRFYITRLTDVIFEKTRL